MEKLKEEGVVTEVFLTKARGDQIDGDMRSSNRVGSFVVEASSIDELNNKVSYCMENVEAIDVNGANMLYRP